MSEHRNDDNVDLTLGRAIYILYLLNVVTGFTAWVGIVVAYIANPEGVHWLAEHYRFQRRTFWLSCLYAVIGLGLLGAGIGVLCSSGSISAWLWIALGVGILLLNVIWFLVRAIRGWQALERRQAPRHPDHWGY